MRAALNVEVRTELVGKVEQFLRNGTSTPDILDGLCKHLHTNLRVSDCVTEANGILNEAIAKVGHPAVKIAVEKMQGPEFIDPLPELPAFLKNIPTWIRWRLETG